MRLATAAVLTVVSAALYGLSFPTASVQNVAWIALVPFLLALRGAGLARALVLGWLWTMGAAYAVGDWFPSSVATYYQQPLAVGVGFFVFVASCLAAPYYMAFAAVHRLVARRASAARPLVVAAAWVVAELARARLAGNPWALFGYSQIGRDVLSQIADATSVYGITFTLVAVNAAIADGLAAVIEGRRVGERARDGAPALRGAAIALALVAAVFAYGGYRRATVGGGGDDTRATRVAMIQPNLDLGTQWREDLYGRNLGEHLTLTQQALRDSRPELVVWPENALSFFVEDEPLYRQSIARLLGPAHAQLIAGGPRVVRDAEPVYYNSVFLLEPDGSITATYDKQRLVPFAEFFPIRSLDFLRRSFARVRELTPGASRPPLPTVAGPAGITICNEAMFPEVAAERVRQGAVFFVDPAHDTWLTPKFSAQQFDIVRLRTIEQRRYLVRASTSGPSAIVDPLGRVVDRTEFFTRTVLAGTIHPRTTVTPYARLGDAFAWGCVAVTVTALAQSARRRDV